MSNSKKKDISSERCVLDGSDAVPVRFAINEALDFSAAMLESSVKSGNVSSEEDAVPGPSTRSTDISSDDMILGPSTRSVNISSEDECTSSGFPVIPRPSTKRMVGISKKTLSSDFGLIPGHSMRSIDVSSEDEHTADDFAAVLGPSTRHRGGSSKNKHKDFAVIPGPLTQKMFDELSLSDDSSEFLDEEETRLRKRLNPTLTQSDSEDFGSVDMSLPARAAEQAEHIVRKVLEEAENAEQLVRKLWGGAWKVCHFSSLPKWLQDNDFLHKGHRPPLQSFSACFRSIFRIHTETGNIWTHLLGCLLFVGIAIYFLSQPSQVIPWEEKVVFATFFASAIICLGMSSMFHTVSCHSEPVGKLFSKLDYCGIAVLIIGSFVPWLYYGFYCDYQPKVFYFVLVSVLGAASIIVSMWDKFSEPQFRWLRAGVFACFGLSGIIPALHYLMVKGFLQAVYHASFGWLCLMGMLYLLGAAFYALRVPERFFPGKCDIWFHSHQIFHVLVIAAAFVHYHGISEMAIYRLSMGTCSADEPPIDFVY